MCRAGGGWAVIKNEIQLSEQNAPSNNSEK